MARTVHELQGSLLDDFPEEEEESIEFDVTPVLLPGEAGVPLKVAKRAESLYKVLGHLSNLSKTGIYENIEENPWFQRRVERAHPGRAQAHIEKVMVNRGEIGKAAKTDFKEAYGVGELVQSGLVSQEEAEQMADDFYEGTNKSGYNPDEKNFALSYSDPKNQEKRVALRKVLKKQSPKLKSK